MQPKQLRHFREDDLQLSREEFAKLFGVSTALVGFYENGRSPMSEKFLRKFDELYGDRFKAYLKLISVENLEVVNDKNDKFNGPKIPIYDVDFSAGPLEMFDDGIDIEPIIYMMEADIYSKGAEFAARIYGDSMEEKYHSGSFLLFKEVKLEDIKMGHAYGIRTHNRRTVKYIRKSKTPGHVILAAENKAKYDDEEIRIKDIKKLWEVVGCLLMVR